MRPLFLLPLLLLCVGASSVGAAPPAQGDGPIYTGVWMSAADTSDAQNHFNSGLDLNAFVQLANANHGAMLEGDGI